MKKRYLCLLQRRKKRLLEDEGRRSHVLDMRVRSPLERVEVRSLNIFNFVLEDHVISAYVTFPLKRLDQYHHLGTLG